MPAASIFPGEAGTLRFADVAMDLAAYRVTRNGRIVHLSPTEFRLLRFLMEHPERVFSRGQLLDAIRDRDGDVGSRAIDVYIRRLRQVLNGPDEGDIIRTVRAAGYSLDKPFD